MYDRCTDNLWQVTNRNDVAVKSTFARVHAVQCAAGQRRESYLIFVIFFTLTYFEAWKFYTQKCVNSRQKLPRNKTAQITASDQNKFHINSKITHFV